MATWHTATSAQDFWADSVRLTASQVTVYLTVARDACLSRAPLPAGTTDIPENYRLAQALHARNLYNAAQRDGQGGGEMGYTPPSFPLDWHIVQLLTPSISFGAIA